MKFLIVEDEYISRSKLEGILSDFGECTTAKNGSEALLVFEKALLELTPFTLVTLDIQMPNLNGHAVAVQMRELEEKYKHRCSKILMVTGMTDRMNISSAMTPGGADGRG